MGISGMLASFVRLTSFANSAGTRTIITGAQMVLPRSRHARSARRRYGAAPIGGSWSRCVSISFFALLAFKRFHLPGQFQPSVRKIQV
jgi:hypothetical protein